MITPSSLSPLCAVALAFFAAPIAGQDEASALAWMVDHADVVSVAGVRAVRTEPGAMVRVTLRLERHLAGQGPDLVTLEEPDGQGCGRALLGLVPGQRVLACLRRRGDTFVPCTGGGRGLPLATPALVQHAQDLIAADPRARVQLLVAALSASDTRIREDAALALPLMAGLESANDAARAAVVAALTDAISTSARTVPSLLVAGARLGARGVIDVVLPLHLAGDDAPYGDAFVVALTQIDPTGTAERLAHLPLASGEMRLRAVRLLRRLDVEAATPALWAVLRQAAEPGVRVQACAALLAAGARPVELRASVDPDALAAAIQLAAPAAPRLRFVQPRSR